MEVKIGVTATSTWGSPGTNIIYKLGFFAFCTHKQSRKIWHIIMRHPPFCFVKFKKLKLTN
jgi:hypothetical protein